MKKCKQCGTESSDATKKCPGCNNDISKASNYELLKLDKRTKLNLFLFAFIIVIFASIFIMISGDSADSNSSTNNTTSDTSKNSSSDLSKDEILSLDNKIFTLVTTSDDVTSILQQSIDAFSKGEITSLDLYDIAKSTKETQASLSIEVSKLDNEKNQAYVDSAVNHIINGQLIASNIVKYLDKEELKYLSEAKSALENTGVSAISVVSERTNYLSSQGFNDEEITDILSSKSDK